jgi:hypothetical protein
MTASLVTFPGSPTCRVWLSELPAEYLSVGGSRKKLTAPATSGIRPSDIAVQVAIEAYKPAGPRFFFGMLGGSFEPDAASDGVRVVVECATDDSPSVSGTLAGSMDKVHSGIPEWVADVVLQSAKDAAERHQGIRGMVTLSYGAFGEASSSGHVFDYLTRVLFALLDRAAEASPLDQDEVARIISEHQHGCQG